MKTTLTALALVVASSTAVAQEERFETKGFFAGMSQDDYSSVIVDRYNGGTKVDELVLNDAGCDYHAGTTDDFWADEGGHPATHICDGRLDYSNDSTFHPAWSYSVVGVEGMTLGGYDVQYVSYMNRTEVKRYRNADTQEAKQTVQVKFYIELDPEQDSLEQSNDIRTLKEGLIEFHGATEGAKGDMEIPQAEVGSSHGLILRVGEGDFWRAVRVETVGDCGFFGCDRTILVVTIHAHATWEEEVPDSESVDKGDF